MIRRATLLLAILGFLAAPPAKAADLIVGAETNFLIDATIKRRPVRLRVDPAASGYILLNAEAVARIGLRPSLTRSRSDIGPITIYGSSQVARLSIDGVTGERRMVWLDGEMVANADGLISPADLHYDRVIFTLGPAGAGEAAFELPLAFDRTHGLFVPLRLGEDLLRVRFSLGRPDSVATAAAGARLSELLGGRWTGAPRDRPIGSRVMRPVRPMRLAQPVDLNGLLISEFGVRISDNRGDLPLPPDPDADPSEIVVTGSRQRALFELLLGRDRLGQCSRLIWDNRRRRMTLHCTNPAAAAP